MKLSDLSANLAVITDRPISDFSEVLRALREGSGAEDDRDDEFDVSPEELAASLASKRGPKGGVEASPFRVGMLLIALMLRAPRRSIMGEALRVWHLATQGSVLSGWGDDFKGSVAPCRMTGEFLFGGALMKILDNQEMARRVAAVRVSDDRWAEIEFDDGTITKFEKPIRQKRLTTISVLDGMVIHAAAQLLKR